MSTSTTSTHGRLIEELADVFSDPDTATLVVRNAGFPRRHIPRFSTPLVFWSAVIQAVLDGTISGGVDAVVLAAKKHNPYNPIFSGYGTTGRPTGSSQSDAKEPSPGMGTRTRRVAGRPTHTSIMLDRTEAWGSLVADCSSPRYEQANLVFIVHGDQHQDLGLFMRRIEKFFDDREHCDRIHEVISVRPEHDFSRATAAEDWDRATWDATRSGAPPLEEALEEQTLDRPLLLLLSGSEPLRALDPQQRAALGEFLAERLPEALREASLAHPVRVVVPIENDPNDAGRTLVEQLHMALGTLGPELRLRPPIRLVPPDWGDVLGYVMEAFRRRGVPLTDERLEQIRASHAELMAQRPLPRLQQLADTLHVLIEALVREAKGRR